MTLNKINERITTIIHWNNEKFKSLVFIFIFSNMNFYICKYKKFYLNLKSFIFIFK